MASYPVKWFDSSLEGAPTIAYGFGQLVAMLDAVLVNGFNIKAVGTITRVDTTATVHIPLGHAYKVGQIVRIDDVDQPEYGGEQRVTWVDSNNFRFEVSGAPVTPATTGTAITCRAAPLGWEIVYSAGNKRVYRAPTGLRHYLRVDNTEPVGWVAGAPVFGDVKMARDLSDIDALIDYAPYAPGPMHPSWGHYKWYQKAVGLDTSYSGACVDPNRSVPNKWWVVGDPRLFYFATDSNATGTTYGVGKALYAFGEFNSFKPADTWNSLLFAAEHYNVDGYGSASNNKFVGNYLAGPENGTFNYQYNNGQLALRDVTGMGVPPTVSKVGLNCLTNDFASLASWTSGKSTGIAYPNLSDFSLMLTPAYLKEHGASKCLRGTLPGMFGVVTEVGENVLPLTIFDTISGMPGRQGIVMDIAGERSSGTPADSGARLVFDISQVGWR